MIPFNKPSITEIEKNYVFDALTKKLCGDGEYTAKVVDAFSKKLKIENMLLTTSCTHALEIAAIILNIKKGDEVILPSYTFVSTVNAFLLRGATPVFCEIEPSTMNMDVSKIEKLITPKTKVIVPVHYAGVLCDMDKINEIAARHGIYVVEDAAQAVGNTYKGKQAGTLGDIGCFSFHETKNYSMGEGGAIIIKDENLFKKAEIVREKGTNRSQFYRGQVDKYTWNDIGSSYLPSDVLAAMLYGQIERFDEITEKRLAIWNRYNESFANNEKKGQLARPFIPFYSGNNAHLYFMIMPTEKIRNQLIANLNKRGIGAVFHYIPLHSSPMGQSLGFKADSLPITEDMACRLIRLPLYADLSQDDQIEIINQVKLLCQ